MFHLYPTVREHRAATLRADRRLWRVVLDDPGYFHYRGWTLKTDADARFWGGFW